MKNLTAASTASTLARPLLPAPRQAAGPPARPWLTRPGSVITVLASTTAAAGHGAQDDVTRARPGRRPSSVITAAAAVTVTGRLTPRVLAGRRVCDSESALMLKRGSSPGYRFVGRLSCHGPSGPGEGTGPEGSEGDPEEREN